MYHSPLNGRQTPPPPMKIRPRWRHHTFQTATVSADKILSLFTLRLRSSFLTLCISAQTPSAKGIPLELTWSAAQQTRWNEAPVFLNPERCSKCSHLCCSLLSQPVLSAPHTAASILKQTPFQPPYVSRLQTHTHTHTDVTQNRTRPFSSPSLLIGCQLNGIAAHRLFSRSAPLFFFLFTPSWPPAVVLTAQVEIWCGEILSMGNVKGYWTGEHVSEACANI